MDSQQMTALLSMGSVIVTNSKINRRVLALGSYRAVELNKDDYYVEELGEDALGREYYHGLIRLNPETLRQGSQEMHVLFNALDRLFRPQAALDVKA
jgi:hypothetical protein